MQRMGVMRGKPKNKGPKHRQHLGAPLVKGGLFEISWRGGLFGFNCLNVRRKLDILKLKILKLKMLS